jgi:flagellar biosynthesis protein FlhG
MMKNQAHQLSQLVKTGIKSRKTKVISFVSGKGGVGKTSIATSLAYVLANSFNKRVLLLDCDIGLGNIHILLKLPPEKNLKLALTGTDIKQVIQRIYNFDVVLGFSGIESLEEFESFESANVIVQLEKVIENYDYVLLDNSAGITRFTLNFSRASDETYVITTPEPTSLTDAYAFIKTMKNLFNYSNFKIIVNMTSNRREGFETFERLKSSAIKFLNVEPKLGGIIPASNHVKEGIRKGNLIVHHYPSDKFSVEIKKIAQLELGEFIKEDRSNFINKILKFFREGI